MSQNPFAEKASPKTSIEVLKAWELGDVPANQKWVSLEDAQKEIAENKTEFERNNAFTHKRILELEGVIEAANKILDEKIKAWDEAYSVTCDDLQWRASDDLQEVKKTLQFPRKEEIKAFETVHYATMEEGKVVIKRKENTSP